MRRRWLIWSFGLFALLIGCDHGTKHIAEAELSGGDSVEIVSDVLEFEYVENDDTAFSLLGGVLGPDSRRVVLGVLSCAVLGIVAVAVYRRRRDLTWPELIAWTAVGAGAVGNLLDRVLRGYVIDFVHLRHWPVFNMADVFLCVGLAVLLWPRGQTPARDPSM